jgi:hypothetical protein
MARVKNLSSGAGLGGWHPVILCYRGSCRICSDARQFTAKSGQEWTTLEKLRASHRNGFRQYERNLIGIGTVPEWAIEQRALFLQTAQGNFLWDCISLLDEATVEIISALGGLRGIAISHPHYYDAGIERRLRWSVHFPARVGPSNGDS